MYLTHKELLGRDVGSEQPGSTRSSDILSTELCPTSSNEQEASMDVILDLLLCKACPSHCLQRLKSRTGRYFRLRNIIV
jgi:hypothetical protein